ncbi:glycine/sarcosine N-methyltransferase [Kushneria sinocarnis]|uniref:Glycine/sarcosine N-methyltransferase n=1 Tax=Kushneria sinocarnis TaxID=595502 RepID=A0A420WU42_9GAMM|nr:methyltransferase domain-containing protein [Kushneria sinocarnis]RKQ96955.1 glycine/sarcosine N-methyltransferase [Kushneria sinocarnis]
MATAEKQQFGSDPVACRDSEHYQQEYIEGFVDKWDQLIDWESRAESEGDFFIDVLRRRGARKVLDIATGTGFHSTRLIEAGFEVVSCDGSPEMLSKAFENGRLRDHILRTVQVDWRWLNRDIHEHFDAIICLGNSFTHLFSENDRRKALAEFYATLKHDGLLIIDQRNYDAMLDHGYSSKHTYYYCGDNISVYPEYIDEGLARFRYNFPDESVYYLNMFPLRKEYLRRLLREVGFQKVTTYGDFQQTYRDTEPDFFIHLAEKSYDTGGSSEERYTAAGEKAREYYNSRDADNFYHTFWGGEDIHIGLYTTKDESVFDASRRTVDRMAASIPGLGRESKVLDIGSGYGGSARHLAGTYGCRVTGLNISETENERGREANRAQGLDQLVTIIDGSFEDLPFENNAFDVVWSQDAILHSGNRRRVLEEVVRVLRPGGHFMFSDPMQTDNCPAGVLQPILDRIHLDTLGSPGFYRETLGELGLEEVSFEEHSDMVARHYGRIHDELTAREQEMARAISQDYTIRMKQGLQHWVDGGNNGHLAWGFFLFRKPA